MEEDREGEKEGEGEGEEVGEEESEGARWEEKGLHCKWSHP